MKQTQNVPRETVLTETEYILDREVPTLLKFIKYQEKKGRFKEMYIEKSPVTDSIWFKCSKRIAKEWNVITKFNSFVYYNNL